MGILASIQPGCLVAPGACLHSGYQDLEATTQSPAILQVVVQLSEDLLSQAVMMVENSRPTLAINLTGARQYWLEGMLRHEIGQTMGGTGWVGRSERFGEMEVG